MFKGVVTAAALAAGMLVSVSAARAASFTIDFCTATAAGTTECNLDGLAEARLTFEDVVGGDPNDYTATLFFKGKASGAPALIDQVQFKIDGAGECTSEALPSLISSPNAGWTPFFGSVPVCGTSGGDHNSVCADHNGTGVALGNNNTLTWVFALDLADAFGPLSQGSAVNMRASYGQGQFSPGGGALSTGSGGAGNVPEPAALSVMAVGLLGAAWRRRRSA